MIVTGYLSAERIEASTITADKLASNVGSSLDLSSNQSVNLLVENTMAEIKGEILEEAGPVISKVEPENPTENMLWLDISDVAHSILKRWDGENWIETTANPTGDTEVLLGEMQSNISINREGIAQTVSREEYLLGISDKVNSAQVTEIAKQEVMMSITSGEIKNTFTSYEKRVSALETFEDTVTTYQRFSEEGLELGKSTSDIIAKLGNDRLSFIQNGTEVAYISDHKLFVTEANATNRISIGNMNNGYFDWITTSTGLGMKWRE